MGKQTFSNDVQFIPIPGITTYNFVVIGAGGGGASYTNNTRSGPGGAGGNGALVKTTYSNVSSPLTIKIGGGGGGGLVTAGYGEPAGFGGGAGLTQVFNANINIIAAGGSGAAPLTYYQPEAVSGINGVNGGNPGGNDNSIYAPGDGAGSANGTGGSGDSFYGGGQGGSFNPTGAGAAGVEELLINPGGGAGGGGAGINGITGLGGFIAGFAAGGTNGGGSANRQGGGGSAGYGGGAGAGWGGGVFNPGKSGSSAVLYNGANAAGANTVWAAAPYNGMPYGVGGLGGTQTQTAGLIGNSGYVEISWTSTDSHPIVAEGVCSVVFTIKI